MFRKIPIKWRITLIYSLMLATLFAALGYGIHDITRRNLLDSVDKQLRYNADNIEAFLAYQQRQQSKAKRFAPSIDDFIVQFFGESNVRVHGMVTNPKTDKTLFRTKNIRVTDRSSQNALKRAREGLETIETFQLSGGNLIRQLTRPIIKTRKFTGDVIHTQLYLEPTLKTVNTITMILWIAFPIGLFFSLLVSHFMTHRAFKVIGKISNEADVIQGDELEKRLTLPLAKDEFHDLIFTFNKTLDRLEESFKRQKRFTGDVSHELRTSLAVLMGEAELTLRRDRSSDEYKEALQTIATESRHMSQIIENLLLLSRAQTQSVAMNWELLDPQDFLSKTEDAAKSYIEGKNIAVKKTDTTDSGLYASQGYLLLAVKNILINAAKHSPQDSQIIFSVENDAKKKYADQSSRFW